MRSRRWSLPVALLGFLVLVAGSVPAVAQEDPCARDDGWATIRAQWVTEIVALTNSHRASIGLDQLAVSRSLTRAALWKASHMAAYEYMAHDDPAPPIERTWEQRVDDCGYTESAGENIAYGYRTPEEMFQGWLDSPGHRRNIERAEFSAIGVGVATNVSGITYWTQVFGGEDDSANDVHSPPQPGADTIQGAEDSRLTFSPLTNDFDPDGDPIEIVGSRGPDHGRLQISLPGEITYIPDRNFFGEDSFAYTVMDVFGLGAEATVSVSVLGVNDDPDVAGEERRLRAGRSITVDVLSNDRDVDGDRLRLDRIVRGPRSGEIVNLDKRTGTIDYRAAAGAAGKEDRIVYRVTDRNGGAARGTLRLKIRR
ncbi:MAG TPA: Ig-like domain-containing protein [Actinomycetota bacterium]|nr:Ig-like domain-containing protein [Actinomycetota bacterium]